MKGHLQQDIAVTKEEETALANVELERHLTAPGVRRVPVKQGKVRGVLYLPPGPGPFPSIIDTFGTIGGLVETRSGEMQLRSLYRTVEFFLYH